VAFGAFALAGCSAVDPDDADVAAIAAQPRIAITVSNHSDMTLSLPAVTGSGTGWLRVDGHPDWFFWEVPDTFASSEICEDVTHDQVGDLPTQGATLAPRADFHFSWKTNVYTGGEVRDGALGPIHCVHVSPVAFGEYAGELCAELASVKCSGPPVAADFHNTCQPLRLAVGPHDTEVSVEFSTEQFPSNRCAADGP
jgi:hypothetical protein